jgi:hypothetical protein
VRFEKFSGGYTPGPPLNRGGKRERERKRREGRGEKEGRGRERKEGREWCPLVSI